MMTVRLPALLASTALLAGPAFSGALDRTGQPIDPLFEPGGYAELTFGGASPDVSGRQIFGVPTAGGTIPSGASSGDMAGSFNTFGFAVKRDFGPRLSAALIYDQPFGADVDYPQVPYFAAGSQATVDSDAITALMRWRFDENLSVHGGLRWISIDGAVTIPFVTAPAGPTAGQPYDNEADSDADVGVVLGASYEIPAIAMRVSLTYSSETQHRLPTTETGPVPTGTTPFESTTEIELPQSLLLDFQTGIAPETLLFGSIRWADWSDFSIEPAAYSSPQVTGGPILFYPEDIVTYRLGVGRRFTDTFSAALSVTYENQSDDLRTNLGPTSGILALGVGATYDFGDVELTSAVSYGWIGEARTQLGEGVQVGEFEDNDVVSAGVQIAYRF
jgi:long-subunit fatty acid transport protein